MSYRYFITNLLTGRITQEIDLDVQSFSFGINMVGELEAVYSTKSKPNTNWRETFHPDFVPGLVVEKNNIPVWGGCILQARPVQGNDDAVNIRAYTMEGFLDSNNPLMPNYDDEGNPIEPDYNGFYSVGKDQIEALKDIFDACSNIPGLDARWEFPTLGASGISRDVIAEPQDDKTIWSMILEDLCEPYDGLEIMIEPRRNSDNTYSNFVNVGYPRLGNANNGAMFTYPGNIIEHPDVEALAYKNPSVVIVNGAGEGANMVRSIQVDNDRLALGIPRITSTYNRKYMTDQAQVTDTATELLLSGSDASEVPTITVLGNAEPLFGSYRNGDAVRICVTSGFYGQYDTYRRITSMQIYPEKKNGIDQVKISFARSKQDGEN